MGGWARFAGRSLNLSTQQVLQYRRLSCISSLGSVSSSSSNRSRTPLTRDIKLKSSFNYQCSRFMVSHPAGPDKKGTCSAASHLGAMDCDQHAVDASTVLIQNLVHLCSDLRLPVSYKVTEAPQGQGSCRTFFVIVHVLADNAFKKYRGHCSQSDLMLFRGLLLKVTTDASISSLHSAEVQQAFLPKFENEGQDSSIADAIVAAADEHFMVVTIKHSGSLVTLSGVQGFAAKNSLNNEFTAGAALLLQAHYQRVERGDAARAQARLAALMAELRSRHMALSFEMVTGCHGHHGQLPAAEYLVTTSAHRLDLSTGRPEFLSWPDFMSFCLTHGLPVNDTWLIAGRSWAGSARELLDDLALKGGPTAKALRSLSSLVSEGRSAGCLHLPGTYPHDQWQGSRIEGFVVSQGQSVSQDSIQALEQLLPALHASVLSHSQVAAQLRQPYRTLLQRTQGNVETTRAEVADACRAWLPCLGLVAVSKEDKEQLMLRLRAPIERLHGAVKIDLPAGAPLYSRAALAPLGPKTLSQLSSEVRQGQHDQQTKQVLHDMLAQLSLSSTEAAAERKVTMGQVLRTLSGAPSAHQSLRYKKKMMMWSFAPDEQDGGGGAEQSKGAAGAAQPPSSSEEVVGYCMMTFVIRNGLKALALGKPTYLNYVSNLIKNWGLPARQAAQAREFAAAWASWVEAHGGAAAIKDGSYLDAAEPFVAEFLRCRGHVAGAGAAPVERPDGSFQGVLVLLDAPDGLAEAVQAKLHVQHLLRPDAVPAFSRSLVAQGAVVHSAQGAALPPKFGDFAAAAAPHLFVAVQRLGEGSQPDAKKRTSLQMAKRKVLETALRDLPPAGPGAPPRLKFLDAAPRGAAAPAALDATAAQVHDWLGSGAPLQARDPAVICCFVTIPGTGKTVLTAGLQAQLQARSAAASAAGSSGSGTAAMDVDGPAVGGSGTALPAAQVKVLNSDTMKAKIKNFKVNRYWPEVADATDSYLGNGACTLVVADKNLVPSPKGNLERVLGQLSESGATTFAVLPYCAGISSQSLLPRLYEGIHEVPMPLEFIALCMLRVLQRKGHEGGLDASLNTAMSVVAMFVSFYWSMSWQRLRAQVQSMFGAVLELPIMTGLGGMGGNGAAAGVGVSAKMEELLGLIAEGIDTVDCRAKVMLPSAWEQRVRRLLQDPEVSSSLLSLQRPLGELQAEVAAALGGALRPPPASDGGRAAAGGADGDGAAAASARLAPVRWIGIAGLPVEQVLEAAEKLPLAADVKARILAGRPNYHVTLWHMDDPGQGQEVEAIREALLGAVGQEAVVEVPSIYSSSDVTAAQVRMLSAPDEAMQKAFHHITLAVGPKAQPKDANKLPSLVAAGAAQQFELPEPIQLVGQIVAFTQG